MASARFFPFLMISLLFLSLPALAENYPLPGQDYNNIGVRGELILDVNVTLINLAPYPKFVVVNPFYDFQVYRMNNDEAMVGFRNETSGEIVHVLPQDLSKNTLNYRVGFWVYPYETVKVAFRITQEHHYTLSLKDYRDSCSGDAGIESQNYENGTLTGGRINVVEDLSQPICGVVYPQLLNYPLVVRFNEIMPSMDGYVKMLKYEGTIKMELTDVPDTQDDNSTLNREFPLFFAVSEPVIFYNATSYGYEPTYSMNFSEYMNFILGYRGLENPAPSGADIPQRKDSGLFKLTNRLISGPTMPELPETPTIKKYPLDFRIWVVYMGEGVNSFEIKYSVRWDNYAG
ncbi:hypothetical protein A3L09_01125 [Thermococcus profundus]|uniref:Uncharacterized protein n=1 Tax=Thermococcus profundus TaxID=49899 RepID=A0A2Z2M6I6_THEPR|nr:hypothetical protein [Thermococcus profundus]ASJ01960.1 hypothetical protein A3L09_01125 [Thermococcus profundus]